jgi:ATP-dependent protease HslVU (ClpYQ) ATPase subunit
MSTAPPSDSRSCSFCGKDQREVKSLIAGPQVFICDECIGLCVDIISEEVEKATEDIHEALSREVFGQEAALRALSVVLGRHLEERRKDDPQSPAHVLLLGPGGVGKTFLAQVAARLTGRPYAFVDACRFRPGNPLGERGVFETLLARGRNQGVEASGGLVCVEHLDRISARGGDRTSNMRAQHALVALLDGTSIVTSRSEVIDTSRTLFLATGRFKDLDSEAPTDAALVRAGLIPELAVRFSHRLVLNRLGPAELLALSKGSSSRWLAEEVRLAEICAIEGEYSHRDLKDTCGEIARGPGSAWTLSRALALGAMAGMSKGEKT